MSAQLDCVRSDGSIGMSEKLTISCSEYSEYTGLQIKLGLLIQEDMSQFEMLSDSLELKTL